MHWNDAGRSLRPSTGVTKAVEESGLSNVNNALNLARELLFRATKNIDALYFQLPVAGRENPVYRERVYCYELYHQMRQLWPPDFPFKVTGEIDKTGHPWIYGNDLDQSKPDFTIHVPGRMGHNLLVVEVKAKGPSDIQIVADLRKLTAFRNRADYPGAIYLVYGMDEMMAADFAIRCASLAQEYERIDLTLVQLASHKCPAEEATFVAWPSP